MNPAWLDNSTMFSSPGTEPPGKISLAMKRMNFRSDITIGMPSSGHFLSGCPRIAWSRNRPPLGSTPETCGQAVIDHIENLFVGVIPADEVAGILQERLSALNDLHLTLKHVHWNVVGPNFISVHEMLDPQVEAVRGFADDVAERIATLGGSPKGTPGTIVAQRSWDDYSIGRAPAIEHLGALDERRDRGVAAVDRGAEDGVVLQQAARHAPPLRAHAGVDEGEGPGVGERGSRPDGLVRGALRGLLAKALPQTASDLRFLESSIKPTSGVPVKSLAYCFCEL